MATKTNENLPKATAIDLFSGAGGTTEGLIKAGYSVLAAVENNPIAVETYRSNHAAVKVVESDIRQVVPSELAASLNLQPGQLTLLEACPPCQGFSSLGKSDKGDPRNELILDVWRFISALKPRGFLIENVPGLARTEKLTEIVRQSRAIGYGVRGYLVDAADYGVPQRRRRLIVVGVRGRPKREIPEDLKMHLPSCFDAVPCSAGEALRKSELLDLSSDPIHRHRTLQPKTLERIECIPINGNRFDLPEEHILPCHSKLRNRNATASYGRIQPALPAPTLTSRCTTPACGSFIHPWENRGLTLREAAILQTFPISYQFRGNYGQIEAQIGNALPVQFAKALGLITARLLFFGARVK